MKRVTLANTFALVVLFITVLFVIMAYTTPEIKLDLETHLFVWFIAACGLCPAVLAYYLFRHNAKNTHENTV